MTDSFVCKTAFTHTHAALGWDGMGCAGNAPEAFTDKPGCAVLRDAGKNASHVFTSALLGLLAS